MKAFRRQVTLVHNQHQSRGAKESSTRTPPAQSGHRWSGSPPTRGRSAQRSRRRRDDSTAPRAAGCRGARPRPRSLTAEAAAEFQSTWPWPAPASSPRAPSSRGPANGPSPRPSPLAAITLLRATFPATPTGLVAPYFRRSCPAGATWTPPASPSSSLGSTAWVRGWPSWLARGTGRRGSERDSSGGGTVR